jgi:hypothetical protein
MEELFEPSEENTQPEDGAPRVNVSPHQLGGIRVSVRGADGTVTEARIELPEASILAHHLDALINMSFQSMYARAMMAQQEASKIHLP